MISPWTYTNPTTARWPLPDGYHTTSRRSPFLAKDVLGSPDLAQTIFQKIEQAALSGANYVETVLSKVNGRNAEV